jgi:ParB-like chromosome segregation protein Spo0J
VTIVVDNPKLEQEIPIERIHPDPFQPRLEPDAELADSIRSQGMLQAISVEVIDAGNSAERSVLTAGSCSSTSRRKADTS